MPTLMGYDTDAPQALGEFGKCGVAVSSLADMEVLFDGIPVDQITTSMTINSPACVIWAMYIAAAEKRGKRGSICPPSWAVIPMIHRLWGSLANVV